jgi:four helix bundle protein
MNSPSRPIAGRLWVVQLSENLSGHIQRVTRNWPSEEKEHLKDQLVRSTDSIGSNISEGYARIHIKERMHFISMAQGSLEEALFYLRRARDRELVSKLDASALSGLLVMLSKAIANFAAAQIPKVNGME